MIGFPEFGLSLPIECIAKGTHVIKWWLQKEKKY
jgi:hypothetical protein